MRKCKCGNDVADNAKACPKCGHRFTSGATKFVFGLMVFVVLVAIIIGSVDKQAPRSESNTAPLPSRNEQIADLAKSTKTAKAAKFCGQHPDWSIEDCKTIAERKIYVGMTAEQLRAAWGKPNHINTTITGAGRDEQWVYGDSSFVYVRDNKIYSLQQTK